MSEYQYYEFQAIDRPLTKEEMADLRSYSTRAQITPTRFMNEYEYGDFRGDEHEWMEHYFDAHLHVANWNTRILMLRLPKSVLDVATVAGYVGENDSYFTYEETDQHVILTYSIDDDQPEYIDESLCDLSPFLPIRSEITLGDYRALYLGWLYQLDLFGADGTEIEPPVPPGLASLTGAQQALVDYFSMSIDLINAAAKTSPPRTATVVNDDAAVAWVRDLAAEEKDAILVKMLIGDHREVAAELVSRFQRTKSAGLTGETSPRRTFGELRAAAKILRIEREQAERTAAEEAQARRPREEAQRRNAYLDLLVGREGEIWKRIDAFANESKKTSNDEAIRLIEALRDLAKREGRSISGDIAQLRMRHLTRKAFQRRLDALKLE